MNRYIIEKRDREVVEKFRAVVESKERLKKRNRIRLFGVFFRNHLCRTDAFI